MVRVCTVLARLFFTAQTEFVRLPKLQRKNRKGFYWILCFKTCLLGFFNAFVPTQNEMLVSRMRAVLSSDEIKDILSQKTDNEIWIDNKAERCEKSRRLFRAAIVWSLLSLSGECTSTVSSSSKGQTTSHYWRAFS